MNKKLPVELIGIIKGAIITLVLCLLATLVIYYTEIQETVMPVIGNVILAIGIFWCSCYVSKSYGTKGLLRGLSMGLAFFILMLITTFVADFSLIS
ncbi:MAG: TIGR04086 family membrane protein, partial [Syntrophomonadaceae bacterium]